MKYFVTINGNDYEVRIDSAVIGEFEVHLNGKPVQVDAAPTGLSTSYLLNHVHYETAVSKKNGNEYRVNVDGIDFTAIIQDEVEKRFEQQSGKKLIDKNIAVVKSPMPGLILSVEVEEGQPVNPGDGLIIMEAMKMENELKASARGIVKTIHVQQGDKVEMNVALITLDIR